MIENLDENRFHRLWEQVTKRFECLNSDDWETVFSEYLNNKTAIRFCNPGEYIPNMEVKFAHQPLEQEALEQRLQVTLNGMQLFISPLELQIAFKLFLGSDKDIEDAKHLHIIFKEFLNQQGLQEKLAELNQTRNARRYLGD